MFDLIKGNMTRQFKALELLQTLLLEEFEFLCARDTDSVTTLEFSIHELLRQIAIERVDLKKTMQDTSILEYSGLVPEDEGQEVKRLYYLIDSLEQHCSRQASQNAEISLALLDQSQALLVFLHDQITPRPQNTYCAKGKYRDERPSAALISGRL
jgi:hypothetical protein